MRITTDSKPVIGGSSPPRPAKEIFAFVAQLAEHNSCKVGVLGSNPSEGSLFQETDPGGETRLLNVMRQVQVLLLEPN